MKILNSTAWAYTLMGLMTLGYLSFLLFAADMVNEIIKRDFVTGGVPGPTRLFTIPEAAWVWCILAVVSLIGNMAWGFWRAKRSDLPAPHHLPIICHLLWIVTWTYFHLFGFLLPIFKMGETF